MDAPREEVFPWEMPQRPNTFGGAPLLKPSREAIVHMYANLGMEPKEIAPYIPSPRVQGSTIHVETVHRVLKYWAENGHVEDKGRVKTATMHDNDARVLISIVDENPWLFLQEIASELQRVSGTMYSPFQCWSELHKRGYSRKEMQKVAAQRDEENRHLFFTRLGEICTDRRQLAFLDETAKDDAKLRRMMGWGLRGKRVQCNALFTRGEHTSVLALYGISGFISFDWKKGSYKAHDFMMAVEDMVIPHLNPYPGPNSILVLDNCRMHHTYEKELVEAVHAVGAEIIFLAPYSPVSWLFFCSFSAPWLTRSALLADRQPDRVRF